MTVPATTRKAGPFIGNGVQTVYPFAFKVFAITDVKVVVADLSGTETTLAGGYTVTKNADQAASPGGNVTMTTALASGFKLSIVGNLPYDQTLALPGGGNFNPVAVENALDRTVEQIQQVADTASRALLLPTNVGSGVSAALPAPASSMVLGWNDSGTALQNVDASVLASVIAYGTANSDIFSGDGVTTTFNLTNNPGTVNNLDVAIGGVVQRPGLDYVWTSGTLITFTTAPPAGTNNVLARYMQALALGSSDSANATFVQTGSGAVQQTVQNALRQVVLHAKNFGVIDTTGAVECTSVLALAFAAGAAQGRPVVLPEGTLLLDAMALPAGLPGVIGAGKYATTLRFKRQAYASGQVLLNASSNTAAIELSNFTIDCNDGVFKTAGVYALALNNSNYVRMSDLRVNGRGAAAVFTSSMVGGRIDNLTVDATGGAGNTFVTCFQGEACVNVIVSRMRTTGFPAYSGVFGQGGYASKFEMCSSDGTSGSFGYSLGGCSFCHMLGITTRNTSHEGLQITDSLYCVIDAFSLSWDAGFGVDAGLSIHGKTVQTRLNRVGNGIIVNSYGPGLLCADSAQGNIFEAITLRDCGVRGYAAAPDPSSAVIGQYTELAGVQCTGQTFRNIKIFTETGPVLNGYSEANNGAGATINTTRLIDIEWQGGNTITQRYKTLSATSCEIWDLDFQVGTPTVTAAGGALGSYTATMSYRRRGKVLEVPKLAINITSAGTGTGALTVLWGGAPNAASSGGALSGVESAVSGKGIAGLANAGGVVLRLSDGTSPIATGAAVVIGGSYILP